jgi:hypothetical protein
VLYRAREGEGRRPEPFEQISLTILERLMLKKMFQEEMEGAPDWARAVSFGNAKFYIQTDIPRRYYVDFTEKYPELLDNVAGMLETLLGEPGPVNRPVRIQITGSGAVFRDLVIEHRGKDYQPKPYEHVLYDHREQLLVVLFEGSFTWHMFAAHTTHVLLRQGYAKNPTRLFSEGLATHIANTLEKESLPKFVQDQLEFFNWRYDNGRVQGFESLFDQWESMSGARFSGVSRENAIKIEQEFHNNAWSLMRFLAVSENPAVQDFFRKYQEYEANPTFKDAASTRIFFAETLGEDLFREMGYQWIDDTLALTFESV